MTSLIRDEVVFAAGEAPLQIVIEVEDGAEHRLPVSNYTTAPEAGKPAQRLLEQGMQLIRALAKEATDAVRGVSEEAGPSEIQVEFGIKLSGEVGAFLAKTGAEGHLRVTLMWSGSRE